MFKIQRVVVGQLAVNCYIIWNEKAKEAFVIDPGSDAGNVYDVIKEEGLTVKGIINTHGHFDHVGGIRNFKELAGTTFAMHKDDVPLLERSAEQSAMFGLSGEKQPLPDYYLTDNMEVEAEGLKLKVIHTPGHTPGGVCFYSEEYKVLVTGDTLFQGSVGRTDLPGGDFETLMDSLKNKLMKLPSDVVVYPGHGMETTIGEEREYNPFLLEN